MPRPETAPANIGHALVVGNIRHPQEVLLQAGYKITWLTWRDRTLIPDEDDVRRCSRILMLDREMSEADIVRLVEVLSASDPFTAICSFHDEGQPLAARLAEGLGLPFHLSAAAAEAAHDKAAMRRRLAEAGLATTRSAQIASPSDLIAFAEAGADRARPVIVKPVSGTGSLGVRLLSHDEALRAQTDLGEGVWMAEDFVHGPEFSVEAFTVSGHHTVLAVTEKFKQRGTFMESGHLMPARIDPGARQRMIDYVCACLDAFGLNSGPSHSEVILSADGPVLVETHTRVGGDHIPKLVELSTGIDLHTLSGKAAIGLPIGGRDLAPAEEGLWACSRFAVQEKTGRVRAVAGLDEARALPGIVVASASYAAGDVMLAVRHSFDRAAGVVATGDSPEAALALADKALGMIVYDVEEGNEPSPDELSCAG